MTSIPVKKALNALLRDPGNVNCADCKSQQHPRWASWSLGVFICIKCAGIHRSLGTHISKVKSVDLDTWKEEHLSMLIKMQNNDKANEYYENKLNHDMESQRKLTKMLMDTNKLSVFIRNKYENKKWCGNDVVHVANNGKKEESVDLLNSSHTITTGGAATISKSNSRKENTSHPLLNLNKIGTQSQPNMNISNSTSSSVSDISNNNGSNNNRPNLKKSILSLYSKPNTTTTTTTTTSNPIISTNMSSTPSLTNNNNSSMNFNTTNFTNINNSNNNSTISLDDHDLFKNVWQ